MRPTSVATAGWINRTIVFGIPSVFDVDAPFTGEQLPVPGVPGREDAVEHGDAASHRLDQVLWRTCSHQITRSVPRQAAYGVGHDGIHQLNRFADAQSADRVAFEADRHRRVGALVAKILEHPSLNDTELRLTRVGGTNLGARRTPDVEELRAASRGPSDRAFHGVRGFIARRWIREALVEHHRNVGPEPRLNLHRILRRQHVQGTIQMRAKLCALFVDLPSSGEAEYLIPAAVGEDRMWPADELMQPTSAGDQLVARPQIQVIGVAEDDLRAGLLEIAVERRLDASLRADRHERGCLHDAVRRAQLAQTRTAVGCEQREAECSGHATIRSDGPAEAGPYVAEVGPYVAEAGAYIAEAGPYVLRPT